MKSWLLRPLYLPFRWRETKLVQLPRLPRAGAPLSKEWDGLVPENGMRQYNSRLDPHSDCATDDMANAIAMRADIHRAFDEYRFIFTGKDGL